MVQISRTLCSTGSLAFLFVAACNPTGNKTITGEVATTNPKHSYFVSQEVALRVAPTDARHIAHPARPRQMVRNWRGVLLRGRQVEILRDAGLWVEVRVLDKNGQNQGWVKRSDLVLADGLTLATTAEALAMFSGPDTTHPNGLITAGTLVFVRERGDHTSLVHAEGKDGYVMSDRLLFEEDEVEAARLVTMARSIGNSDSEEAAHIFDKMRIQYPRSKLIDVAAEEVSWLDFHETPVMPTHLDHLPR